MDSILLAVKQNDSLLYVGYSHSAERGTFHCVFAQIHPFSIVNNFEKEMILKYAAKHINISCIRIGKRVEKSVFDKWL